MDIVKSENEPPTFPKDNLSKNENRIDIDNFIASRTRISRAMNEEMINQM